MYDYRSAVTEQQYHILHCMCYNVGRMLMSQILPERYVTDDDDYLFRRVNHNMPWAEYDVFDRGCYVCQIALYTDTKSVSVHDPVR